MRKKYVKLNPILAFYKIKIGEDFMFEVEKYDCANGTDYIASIKYLNRHARKTSRSNDELLALYRNNPTKKLRDELFVNNLGLLMYVVNKYAQRTGETTADMVSFASMALMRAIDQYDYEKSDAKFSSYAIASMFKTTTSYMMSLRARAIRNSEDALELDAPIEQSLASSDDDLTLGDAVLIDYNDPEAQVVGKSAREEISKTLNDVIDNSFKGARTQEKVIKTYLASDNKLTKREVSQMIGVNHQFVSEAYAKGVARMRNELCNNPQKLQELYDSLDCYDMAVECAK